MVNRVILIGNLGKDPEIRRLENGAVVAKFTIATNESYKDKNGEWKELTEWHDVVVWRSLAERAEATLKKGMPVYVEGKLTHRTWQDQDGNNRKSTEVVASYFRALAPGRREGDGGSGHFPGSEDEYPMSNTSPSGKDSGRPITVSDTPPITADDDDLPF